MFRRLRRIWKDLTLRVPKRRDSLRARGFFDGGTTLLEGFEEQGDRRTITLTQSTFPPLHWWDARSGRLYLGRRLVPRGGRAEQRIIELIEQLLLACPGNPTRLGDPHPDGPLDADDYLASELRRILGFVRSADYGRTPAPM